MTDFLYDPGTSGFIVTSFNLQTTELNSLASGGTSTSSVGGSSGVFNQTNTGNALLGAVWLVAGGAFTPTAGGNIAGWFLRSTDGGTTFERTSASTAQPRAPDFVIPLFASAYAANNVQWANGGEVLLPPESFKVYIQNNSGVALPASANVIKLGPIAVKY